MIMWLSTDASVGTAKLTSGGHRNASSDAFTHTKEEANNRSYDVEKLVHVHHIQILALQKRGACSEIHCQ